MAITSASLPAKKRILTVCVRLFLEKGYKRSTLAEIIEKADVSYSTFQNIFRAKDGVLTELVEFKMCIRDRFITISIVENASFAFWKASATWA